MKFLILFLTMFPLFSEDNYSIEHALVSFYAIHSDTGEVLIDKNSDISLTPKSCMKLVTTAAALHILGPKNRFETQLEYSGSIDSNKTLHGHLYIRGGGDPCLGSDRISGSLSWKNQIKSWADAIPIKRIEGKIIGDATKWEKALAVPSWEWEDLGNYYGAGASALSFHENFYSLYFKPSTQVGEKAAILRTEPPQSRLCIENEVTTGPKGSGDRACIFGSEFSWIQFVRGTVPAGVDEFVIKGAIPDPATYCAELLTRELIERGISIEQREFAQQNGRTSFHTTFSPTIAEIVHWTNQGSVNIYAEHLLKKMGEAVYSEGSIDSGIKAVTNFWKSQRLDLNGFHMADGSGLSTKNLITAKQLVEILLIMKKSNLFPLFYESLPCKEGIVRAKSGSSSFVKAYAGYAGPIVFAILINNCPNHQLRNEKISSFLSHLNTLYR